MRGSKINSESKSVITNGRKSIKSVENRNAVDETDDDHNPGIIISTNNVESVRIRNADKGEQQHTKANENTIQNDPDSCEVQHVEEGTASEKGSEKEGIG